MTNENKGKTEDLIEKTSNLRDELLVAVVKLETYAEELRKEAIRLRRLTEEEKDE